MKNRRFSSKIILSPAVWPGLFRILLIPPIIWLCCRRKQYAVAIAAIAVSGAAAIIDGRVAGKTDIVSRTGNALSLFADRLTQAALMICLIARYRWMWALLALFAVKECLIPIL